jgi:hypothetical protein
MSGQSCHEITVSRESRHGTTALPTKADGFDEAADGRLLTDCVEKVAGA